MVKRQDARRTALTPEQRLLVLDTWERSGLSAADFAALVGLSKHTLYAWKKAAFGDKVIELVEELLVRRFPNLGREELQAMFDLEDLRKTRVWREAKEEGRQEKSEELVQKWLAKGMAIREIAALLDTTVPEVRRLSKNGRR